MGYNIDGDLGLFPGPRLGLFRSCKSPQRIGLRSSCHLAHFSPPTASSFPGGREGGSSPHPLASSHQPPYELREFLAQDHRAAAEWGFDYRALGSVQRYLLPPNRALLHTPLPACHFPRCFSSLQNHFFPPSSPLSISRAEGRCLCPPQGLWRAGGCRWVLSKAKAMGSGVTLTSHPSLELQLQEDPVFFFPFLLPLLTSLVLLDRLHSSLARFPCDWTHP